MLPEIIQETASLSYQAYDTNDQDEGVLEFFFVLKIEFGSKVCWFSMLAEAFHAEKQF